MGYQWRAGKEAVVLKAPSDLGPVGSQVPQPLTGKAQTLQTPANSFILSRRAVEHVLPADSVVPSRCTPLPDLEHSNPSVGLNQGKTVALALLIRTNSCLTITQRHKTVLHNNLLEIHS